VELPAFACSARPRG